MHMVDRVTSEEVKAAAHAVGITRVPIHNCSMCGYECAYIIQDGQLFYDSGCHCTFMRGGWQPRDWSDAAESINIQNDPKWQQKMREAWGFR